MRIGFPGSQDQRVGQHCCPTHLGLLEDLVDPRYGFDVTGNLGIGCLNILPVNQGTGFAGQFLGSVRQGHLLGHGNDFLPGIGGGVLVYKQTIPEGKIQVGHKFRHGGHVRRQANALGTHGPTGESVVQVPNGSVLEAHLPCSNAPN